MKRDKKWESQEIEEYKSESNINHCPVCGVNGVIGAFCQTHLDLLKDYNWIKNYLNTLDSKKYDHKTIHIIDSAVSDRVSYVINDVEIVDGKLAIEKFLQENLYGRLNEGKTVKCSQWMEKTLLEILNLQRARDKIIEMMKSEGEC